MKIVESRARRMKKLVKHTECWSGNLPILARWNIPVNRKGRNKVKIVDSIYQAQKRV